jgi:hypothetical protein
MEMWEENRYNEISYLLERIFHPSTRFYATNSKMYFLFILTRALKFRTNESLHKECIAANANAVFDNGHFCTITKKQ